MGISGLLPLLKSIHKHCTLKKFAGQTIGVDAYGWLHRGAVACALELALDKPTSKYVDFAMSRVRMLLDFGVVPYLVFDGDALPSKAGTNAERRKRREESKKLGLELYRSGKVTQAYQELQKAVPVTPYMARLLIEELKKLNVQYIVAPYEADAQLAYLEQKGIINGILSEDSDLLVFGAKRLLTKLNQYGECIEIERADFALCKEVSLVGWTDPMFRRMAILSGCDYLPNIEKMGLKTAYRYVRKYTEADKVIRMIQFEGKFSVPTDYVDRFQQAELTFLHHRVFCPLHRELVFLNELDKGRKEADMPYLGERVDPEVAIGVACGDIDPKTKQLIKMPPSSSAGRPSLGENRRQTLSSTADLKPNKSLESFFKVQRQPLAELDPNSLTPSPSQQRLLQRNSNASWEPRLVASAPQLRRTAITSMGVSSTSRSFSAMTDRNVFLARASTLSTYKPPKRQRLCSEGETASSAEEVKHSPFFSKVDQPSPLAPRKTKSRKAQRSGIDIWSDDSVDDILLGLPDVQQVANPSNAGLQSVTKTIHTEAIRQDEMLESVPQSPVVRNSGNQSGFPVTEVSVSKEMPKSMNCFESPNDACVSREADQSFVDLLDQRVQEQQKSLLRTFTYQSPSKQHEALKSLKLRSLKNEIGDDKSQDKPAPTPRSAAKCPSPDGEPHRLCTASTMDKTFLRQSPVQRSAALESLKSTQSIREKIELGIVALANKHKNNRSSPSSQTSRRMPKPFPQRGSVSTTSSEKAPTPLSSHDGLRLTGSEDAIIPNSEDELSEAEGDTPLGIKMNLKAFTFVPV